jgi:HdeA/HdeB family protein
LQAALRGGLFRAPYEAGARCFRNHRFRAMTERPLQVGLATSDRSDLPPNAAMNAEAYGQGGLTGGPIRVTEGCEQCGLNAASRRFEPVKQGATALSGEGKREAKMKLLMPLCAMTLLSAGVAQAQVDLTTYADAKGNLDIQALTCAQLANTYQEDADFMTVWYSGWYNGLAGYSKLKVDRAKELEHRVIVYCKANPKTKVIAAMDIQIKKLRKEQGIKVNDEK